MAARLLFVGVLTAVGLVGGTGGPAHSEEKPSGDAAKVAELEKRVKELEEIVRRLESKIPQAPPMPMSPGQPEGNDPDQKVPATGIPGLDPSEYPSMGKGSGSAGWKDGFFLQSADKAHTLRITGQIQADYRSFFNNGDTTDTDTFLLRRARLGIEATVFNFYEFRFLPDWGGSTSGRAIIQDSFMNVHYWDAFQFQMGKFKQPVSYEQLIQDRFVPTMERSMIDQLVPARDVGLMIHGQKLLGDRLDWAFGVFNGETNGGGTTSGTTTANGTATTDFDTNKLRDYAGRIAVRPFRFEFLPEFLHGLQIGISGTTGFEKETQNPLTLRTPATVPWFAFNNSGTANKTVLADGLRNRWTPEVSYFYRSFGFSAQYFEMDQEVRAKASSLTRRTVPFDGYYAMLTYLLTGEERTTWSKAVEPLRPFDPCHPFSNPGAWELVARFSHLHVDDSVFTKINGFSLSDPNIYANAASELSVGFNWYLNSMVRVQFNWEHAWFNRPVLLGTSPNTFFRNSDTLLTRFQVIF